MPERWAFPQGHAVLADTGLRSQISPRPALPPRPLWASLRKSPTLKGVVQFPKRTERSLNQAVFLLHGWRHLPVHTDERHLPLGGLGPLLATQASLLNCPHHRWHAAPWQTRRGSVCQVGLWTGSQSSEISRGARTLTIRIHALTVPVFGLSCEWYSR